MPASFTDWVCPCCKAHRRYAEPVFVGECSTCRGEMEPSLVPVRVLNPISYQKAEDAFFEHLMAEAPQGEYG